MASDFEKPILILAAVHTHDCEPIQWGPMVPSEPQHLQKAETQPLAHRTVYPLRQDSASRSILFVISMIKCVQLNLPHDLPATWIS